MTLPQPLAALPLPLSASARRAQRSIALSCPLQTDRPLSPVARLLETAQSVKLLIIGALSSAWRFASTSLGRSPCLGDEGKSSESVAEDGSERRAPRLPRAWAMKGSRASPWLRRKRETSASVADNEQARETNVGNDVSVGGARSPTRGAVRV